MDCKSKLSVTNRFCFVKKSCYSGKESWYPGTSLCYTGALSGAAQSGGVNMGCESCMALLSP